MSKKVGIYVPSFHRFDKIITANILPTATYVVRSSEAEAYRSNGIENLISVEDELIDSLPKIRQWIIDNTAEDIVIQVDDDVDSFFYINGNNMEKLNTYDEIENELLRVAQMLDDLNLGFSATVMQPNVVKYNAEFLFKSTIGVVCWFNKSALKSRYDENVRLKADMDFELSELLHNRIMLIPAYFAPRGKVDTNKGGNSTGKNSKTVYENAQYLSNKWGRYYSHDFKRNISKIEVKR